MKAEKPAADEPEEGGFKIKDVSHAMKRAKPEPAAAAADKGKGGGDGDGGYKIKHVGAAGVKRTARRRQGSDACS